MNIGKALLKYSKLISPVLDCGKDETVYCFMLFFDKDILFLCTMYPVGLQFTLEDKLKENQNFLILSICTVFSTGGKITFLSQMGKTNRYLYLFLSDLVCKKYTLPFQLLSHQGELQVGI